MSRSEASTRAEGTPAAGARTHRMPAWLRSRWFRALVSLAILAAVISRLNLGDLGDTFSHVALGLLLAGTLLFLLDNAISVYKWRIILRAQGTPAGYFYLSSLFYIGLFFNNFLPTTFGGDVVRAFKLSRSIDRPVNAASSVLVDRASSTFALLLIAIVPALTQLRLLGMRMALVIASLLVLSLLAIGLVASERSAKRLGRLVTSDPFGLRRHARSFYYSLRELGKDRGALAQVLVLSLAYQIVQVVLTYILARSLGVDVDIIYFFIFIPVILIVGMIPFSLNGLGLREGAWVLLFGQVGVPAEQAFSISILCFIVLLVVSLAGGVFYLFDRGAAAVAEPQGEAVDGGT